MGADMLRRLTICCIAPVLLATLTGCRRGAVEDASLSGPKPVAVLNDLPILHWPIVSVVFSPNGETLAVGGMDGSITLIDCRDWTVCQKLVVGSRPVSNLVFSADGRSLAASSDFHVHVWDPVNRLELAAFDHGKQVVTSVTFSADGRQVITTTGSPAGWLRSWDLGSREGAVLLKIDESRLLPADTFSVFPPWIPAAGSADGKVMVVSVPPGFLLYDLPTNREIRIVDTIGARSRICFCAGGRLLATDSDQFPGVPIIDPVDWSRKVQCLTPKGYGDGATDLSFTHDGTILVAGFGLRLGEPGRVCVFDTATGDLLASKTCHPDAVTAARISPDGKHIVTAGFEGAVKVWRTADLLQAGK
jgi:WD40 repeat protein